MDLVFAVAAGLAVGSGVLVVTGRNPVYSAVWLLVCFLSLAVIFVSLEATFLAAMHVLVYTGAILVLFLFVIMLLNLKKEEMGPELPLRARAGAALLCGGLFVLLAIPLAQAESAGRPLPPAPAEFGSIGHVGRSLFTDYALSFELMSVLILVAIFGGVVLAKKKA
jgi:NADH-quinone oxidoreductase subunit J